MTTDFSWDRFDDPSIEAFTRACGYAGADTTAARRDWIAERWALPSSEFVTQARYAIENVWLRRQPEVVRSLVDALIQHGIGPREIPQSQGDCLRFLYQCPNRRSVRNVYREALLRFGCRNPQSDTDIGFLLGDGVPRFAIIKPIEQVPDARKPYPYQQMAWDALTGHFAEAQVSGVFEGLLVMPTGSGKTFTAARWLTEQQLNRGQRIIWLAHRYELLEQAAQAFHRCAALASKRNSLRIRIISGVHCPTSSIGPEDDVLLCSVASLARRPDIAQEILADSRSFLVVDEAHHAAARSYRMLIETLRSQPAHRLLGLTATPTRTLVSEQPVLSRLFGNHKIFEVQTRDLIEQRFLARPLPVHVRTRTAIEETATPEDYRHLEQFAELSEAWLDRIAHVTQRNEAITRHYLDNRPKYGKTLIFAINVAHAELLCERLKEAGIAADYVASYRLSGEKANNREIIERFRRPNSGLDVLINVMILTEGVDIPNVQTVFLTRPTRSEILVRQMVGRALRGVAAGGTDVAYLVSFEDHWQEFEEWEKPLDLVRDLLESEIAPPATEEETETNKLAQAIPWELIRTTANEMRRLTRIGDVEAFEAVPCGWYLLERDIDGELLRQLIPVYEHQQSCWVALLTQLQAEGKPLPSRDTFQEYFSDCDTPRPSRHFVGEVEAYVRATGTIPPFERFADRDAIDPRQIAGEIWEAQLGPMDAIKLINVRYEQPLAQAVYPTRQDFKEAVQRAIDELAEPETKQRAALATVLFQPWSSQLLRPGPHHNLEAILPSVLDQGCSLVRTSKLPCDVRLEWTRRVVTGWYAKAYWDESSPLGNGTIRVNCLLDSPDISSETISFLLWHEFLHLYLQQGHTPAFRALERKWPRMQVAERELDTLRERFDIHWW